MRSIQDRIINEISIFQRIPTDKITPELCIQDSGVDSLEKIELMMNIEDEFDIIIEDDVIEKFVTVKDIIDHVTKIKG